MAAPDYLSEKGIPKAVSDLSRHDCLHFRYMRSGKIAKWPIPEDADTSDTRLPARLIANENLMLIRAARSGLGIACVPDFTVVHYLESGELTRVLEDEVQREIVWWAVWPASPHLPPKLSVFLDFLSSRFAVLRSNRLRETSPLLRLHPPPVAPAFR